MKWLTCAAAVVLLASAPARAQTTPSKKPAAPDGLSEFADRVEKYAALRGDLEKQGPALTGRDDPAHVVAVADALAGRVRAARAGARQGDLFTPAATAAFRKILREIDASSWRIIMDANPGQFPHRVNDGYPSDKPLSTMPPDLLARLPRLPPGLQYRFVGTTLILHDITTNLIVDRMPEAIPTSAPPRRPADYGAETPALLRRLLPPAADRQWLAAVVLGGQRQDVSLDLPVARTTQRERARSR